MMLYIHCKVFCHKRTQLFIISTCVLNEVNTPLRSCLKALVVVHELRKRCFDSVSWTMLGDVAFSKISRRTLRGGIVLHKGPSFPPWSCLSRCWTHSVLACGSQPTAPHLCVLITSSTLTNMLPHTAPPPVLPSSLRNLYFPSGEKKRPSSKCNFLTSCPLYHEILVLS